MPADSTDYRGPQLHLKIVTPEGSFLDAEADMIEFPTTAGELGILPGHTPLVTELHAGEVRVHRKSRVDCYAVAGGFVEIHADTVRMLAWFLSNEDDGEKVDEACERARHALEETESLSPEAIDGEIMLLRAEFVRLAENKRAARSKRH
jgi:F-type H+-transporting ATPase subunit epsilon